MKVGIVGLPNVGKSTLFNALLKKRVALSANYPFATVEPNVGIVAVPDSRLEKLAEIVKIEEKMESLPPLVPAVVEFVDIAGLVKGASTGEGLGNQFLSHIREVDAIIHVLRDFEDDNIVRAGSENPDADRLTIETELGLADLQVLEKLVLEKGLEKEKLEILNRIKEELNQGHVLGNFEVGDEKLKIWFKTLPLLSIKPILYVYNVSEDQYSVILRRLAEESLANASNSGTSPEILRYAQDDTIVICARLEEELADVTDAERKEYLAELGIEETGLERLIKKAYQLLGLASYLTAGKKEVKAWTIKQGMKAPLAAGVIHTDFEKKFIRAQVIDFDKYIEAGSMGVAKSKGWIRTEGKDYIVQDGDVIEFLIGS